MSEAGIRNPFDLLDRFAMPPWLQNHWASLKQRMAADRFPHALLFHGAEGTARHWLADKLCARLLCETPNDGEPCRQCHACQWLTVGSHPDYRAVMPESPGAQIRIDDIRSLNDWLHLTPQNDRYKVAMISPTENMNRHAANSLLKTLEEPPPSVVLVLVARVRGLLPPTILSRCQQQIIQVDDLQAAKAWLMAHDQDEPTADWLSQQGCPMLAFSDATLSLAQQQAVLQALANVVEGKASIARMAETLSTGGNADIPLAVLLENMLHQVARIIRLKLAPSSQSHVVDESQHQLLIHVGGLLSDENWFKVYEQLSRFSRLDGKSFKLQPVLEGIFADIRLKCLESS